MEVTTTSIAILFLLGSFWIIWMGIVVILLTVLYLMVHFYKRTFVSKETTYAWICRFMLLSSEPLIVPNGTYFKTYVNADTLSTIMYFFINNITHRASISFPKSFEIASNTGFIAGFIKSLPCTYPPVPVA